MSTIRAFETPLNDFNREQYTQYLENQLERISSFMLYQKKENEKNNQLIEMIEEQNEKIKLMNDKIHLLEIYQHENFKHSEKVFDSIEKVSTIEKQIEKLEFLATEQKENQYQAKSIPKTNERSKRLNEFVNLNEMNEKFEQLRDKINSIERNLMKKINIILEEKENINQQILSNNHQTKNKMKSENCTPLQTNYTENTKSRIKEIESSELYKKSEHKNREKKVSEFVNERLDNLEREIKMLESEKNTNKSINHLTERSIKEKKEASPISSYLRKENEFTSLQENINPNKERVTKSFYSVLDKENNQSKKEDKKRKRSKSKSEIKSERSWSESNLSKTKISKNFSKKENSENKINLNKIKKSKLNTSSRNLDQKSQKKEDKKMKENKNKENEHYINNLNKKSQKEKDNHKNRKSKSKSKSKIKSNNASQLSLSQNSIKSRSCSKSIDKKLKNQKEYLMCCDKIHY